jgi:hypothetical protein
LPPLAPERPAAAPAPEKPPPALPPDDGPVEKRDESYGLLGPFRIGPVLSGGLPSLVGVGGMIKLTRYFGAGVNVGLIPEVQFTYYGEATVSYQEYMAYGHLHVLGGGFFLGAQIGYAHVSGTYEQRVDISPFARQFPELGLPAELDYTSRGSVQTLVLTPEMGYFHTFGSGFSVGVDGGLQIPIAPSDITFERTVSSSIPHDVADRYFGPHDDKVESTLDKVGRTLLPTAHVRIGWLL